MTRTNAREIAIHFTFELSFSDQSADELLENFFNREYFALLGEEEPLYAEFPNEKQREYISTLVRGAFQHGAELDGYIEKYAVGWKFSRIGRVAAAIMRVAMYEILYMPEVPAGAAAPLEIPAAFPRRARFDARKAAVTAAEGREAPRTASLHTALPVMGAAAADRPSTCSYFRFRAIRIPPEI